MCYKITKYNQGKDMKIAKAIDDLIQPAKRIPNVDSLDKVVAKTVPKEPNWSHILNEESPNDPNSIE
jgi:hypothetical protein